MGKTSLLEGGVIESDPYLPFSSKGGDLMMIALIGLSFKTLIVAWSVSAGTKTNDPGLIR